jgi:hypothetical protein
LSSVLRREQDGRAGRGPRLDHLPHRKAGDRVEAGRRLVEEENGRLEDERGGEVEPPAHAAGVRLRRAPRRLDEVEAREQFVRAGARLPSRQVVQAPDHL